MGNNSKIKVASSQQKQFRNYKIDNLKFIAIVLVVFGHFIELYKNDTTHTENIIYFVIYTFHIPIFVFCSGYLATYNPKKILTNLAYPYIVFQVGYQIILKYIIGISAKRTLINPYWILWYLLSLILWNLILPFFESQSNKQRILYLIFSFLISILSGFDRSIGYTFSLSRTFTYLPFFIGGYTFKNWNFNSSGSLINNLSKKKYIKIIFTALLVFIISYSVIMLCFKRDIWQTQWLYGSCAYNEEFKIRHRLFFLVSGMAWVLLLYILLPNKPIPLITKIGVNTMPVYLLHPTIILFLKNFGIFKHITYKFTASVLLTFFTVLVFSSKPVIFLSKPFVKFPFSSKSKKKSISQVNDIANVEK